jgi:hypothetical protein
MNQLRRDEPISIESVFENLHDFSMDMQNDGEPDPMIYKRLTIAEKVLREHFYFRKIKYLTDLDDSFAVGECRLFLRIFTKTKQIEEDCLRLLASILKIGNEYGCVQNEILELFKMFASEEWMKTNAPNVQKKVIEN